MFWITDTLTTDKIWKTGYLIKAVTRFSGASIGHTFKAQDSNIYL
jgi:hypothetical protein